MLGGLCEHTHTVQYLQHYNCTLSTVLSLSNTFSSACVCEATSGCIGATGNQQSLEKKKEEAVLIPS